MKQRDPIYVEALRIKKEYDISQRHFWSKNDYDGTMEVGLGFLNMLIKSIPDSVRDELSGWHLDKITFDLEDSGYCSGSLVRVPSALIVDIFRQQEAYEQKLRERVEKKSRKTDA
jgi:hypothetical protein